MPTVQLQISIFVVGLPVIENFSFNGFHLRLKDIEEPTLNSLSDLAPFYQPVHLCNNLYSVDEQPCYLLFQNNNYIMNIEFEAFQSLDGLKEHAIDIAMLEATKLQSILRFITNYPVLFPYFDVRIVDPRVTNPVEKSCVFTNVAVKRIRFKPEDEIRILRRLQTGYSWDSLSNTMNQNNRYTRALRFYLDTFDAHDLSTKFILLFTALESLFNLDREKIKDTIASYSSKMLFLEEATTSRMYERLKELYKTRSEFIHGSIDNVITAEEELELREIVRKVLLMYWFIALNYEIADPVEMKTFLYASDSWNRINENIVILGFIKMLEDKSYAEILTFIFQQQENSTQTD